MQRFGSEPEGHIISTELFLKALLGPAHQIDQALRDLTEPMTAPHGRWQQRAARTYGVSAKIVARWAARFRALGHDGMAERSSRPKTIHRTTPQSIVEQIVALRQRLTGKHIAMVVGVSPTTGS